jgi:hypothetical protein
MVLLNVAADHRWIDQIAAIAAISEMRSTTTVNARTPAENSA